MFASLYHNTKYLTSGKGYNYPRMLPAKHRTHFSNENLQILFLLAALKLQAEDLYDYE